LIDRSDFSMTDAATVTLSILPLRGFAMSPARAGFLS
jgi:hypothetical protein